MGMDSPDTWQWIWLATAVFCALGELAAPGTFFVLSFALGAVLAFAAALLDASLAVQWVAFVAGSGVALVLLVPFGRRMARQESDEAQEGATRWVGRIGVVLDEIPAAHNDTGRVRVERDTWRAETDSSEAIPQGSEVEVIAVRGTRLVVVPSSPT
jgi:membrane protein implicated in regulation of membrane protease activity